MRQLPHASQVGGNVAPSPAPQQSSADTASADALVQNTLAWTAAARPDHGSRQPSPRPRQKIEGVLKVLAQRGEVDALWRVSSTMHGIAAEGRGASRLASVVGDEAAPRLR